MLHRYNFFTWWCFISITFLKSLLTLSATAIFMNLISLPKVTYGLNYKVIYDWQQHTCYTGLSLLESCLDMWDSNPHLFLTCSLSRWLSLHFNYTQSTIIVLFKYCQIHIFSLQAKNKPHYMLQWLFIFILVLCVDANNIYPTTFISWCKWEFLTLLEKDICMEMTLKNAFRPHTGMRQNYFLSLVKISTL